VSEGDPKLIAGAGLGDAPRRSRRGSRIPSAPCHYGCDKLGPWPTSQAAANDKQASCAIALARVSLKEQHTAGQIAALGDNTNPAARDFAPTCLEPCGRGAPGRLPPDPGRCCAGRRAGPYA
jgi:hypothetical protein